MTSKSFLSLLCVASLLCLSACSVFRDGVVSRVFRSYIKRWPPLAGRSHVMDNSIAKPERIIVCKSEYGSRNGSHVGPFRQNPPLRCHHSLWAVPEGQGVAIPFVPCRCPHLPPLGPWQKSLVCNAMMVAPFPLPCLLANKSGSTHALTARRRRR
jgi:hypothetical protein